MRQRSSFRFLERLLSYQHLMATSVVGSINVARFISSEIGLLLSVSGNIHDPNDPQRLDMARPNEGQTHKWPVDPLLSGIVLCLIPAYPTENTEGTLWVFHLLKLALSIAGTLWLSLEDTGGVVDCLAVLQSQHCGLSCCWVYFRHGRTTFTCRDLNAAVGQFIRPAMWWVYPIWQMRAIWLSWYNPVGMPNRSAQNHDCATVRILWDTKST